MNKFLATLLVGVLFTFAAEAQPYLREDTASQVRSFGPFLDPADGTAENGLTIDAADVRLKVNGAADVAKNSGGCTADVNGVYHCTFDATDTATVGELNVSACETGAVCVARTFWVLEEAVYDQLFAASATGAHAVSSGGILAASFAAGAVDAAAIAANAIDAATFAADVDAEVLSYIVDDATRIDASELNTDVDSLTFTLAGDVDANTQSISDDTTPANRLEAIYDLTAGSYPEQGVIRGIGVTAQAYTHATPSLTLDAAAAFGDNALTNTLAMICGSTQGYCQAMTIASNVGDVATLVDPLEIEMTGTITYTIFATPQTSGILTELGLSSPLDAAIATINDIDTTTGSIANTTDDLATDVAAVLVDTGTTLQAEIDALEADLDAVLVDTGTTLQGELDVIQAATDDLVTGVPIASYTNAAGDVCLFVISEAEPHITVDCTEAP
jgi:hypothetical protein